MLNSPEGTTSKSPFEINKAVHRSAFCQFPFRWIFYYGSNKSTRKETGKMHLCAVGEKRIGGKAYNGICTVFKNKSRIFFHFQSSFFKVILFSKPFCPNLLTCLGSIYSGTKMSHTALDVNLNDQKTSHFC